jgi:hypothetical protein
VTSDNDNRRVHERIEIRLHVHFARGDKKFVLQSANLSLGGIFLKDAHDVCVEGDDVTLDIIVPSSSNEPEIHPVRGTIVQLIPGIGAGVRFDWHQSMERSRDALVRFIERVGMENTPLLHSESIGLSTDAEEDPRG